MVIQKLKNDLAILREALDKANRTDVGIIEGKLRVANVETAKLRSVNTEMRQRVMALERELHFTRTALSQGGGGGGRGGEVRKPAPPPRPPNGAAPGSQGPGPEKGPQTPPTGTARNVSPVITRRIAGWYPARHARAKALPSTSG